MSTLTANDLPYRNPLQWGGDDAFTHSLWIGPTHIQGIAQSREEQN